MVQHFDQDEHDHHLQITRRVSKVSPARSLLLSESIHFNVYAHSLLMPKHPSICCWRHIFQAEKSGKTNPPGWTHGRSKKGKPFASCNYFLLLSLQRKNIFAAAGERQGGKLGSGVCVGHPRSIIFFFCLAHFPFLLSFFLIFPANQSLISTTNFLTRFPSTA